MASKSRLGKGLGALFPTLPGDPNATSGEPADQKTTPLGQEHHVSRETSQEHSEKPTAGIKRTSVSRETSGRQSQAPTGGSVDDSRAEHASDRHAKGEPQRPSAHTKKRMSVPSLQTMAHPSDLFFGGSADSGNHGTVESTGVSGMSEHSKDMRRMTRVLNDAVLTLGQHDGIATGTAPSDHADANAAASASQPESEVKPEASVSRETPDEAAPSEDATAVPEQTEALKPVEGGYLAELKLSDIGPNKEQPRTIFDEDELRELADSIREVGILQPIVVRKRPLEQIKASQDSDRTDTATSVSGVLAAAQAPVAHMDSPYELIMGERRWRASQLAGLDTIPAIVKTTADNHMLRDALLENLHRVALNPLEEAAAYQQMIDEFGLTQAQLSTSVSKSRPQIANTLRLLNLPASVQKKVAAGVLSAGHARALLGLGSEEEMEKLADRIIAEGLSVRSTEEIVAMKALEGNPEKRGKSKAANPWNNSPIRHNLEQHFDTKVAIRGNNKHGKIEISFSSPDDMQRILDLLMPQEQKADSPAAAPQQA